jgi:DNA replication licensing factor MCM4
MSQANTRLAISNNGENRNTNSQQQQQQQQKLPQSQAIDTGIVTYMPPLVDNMQQGVDNDHILGVPHLPKMSEIMKRVRNFLRTFETEVPVLNVDSDSEQMVKQLKYMVLIRDLVTSDGRCLPVDCKDLHAFDSELYDTLILAPLEFISIFDGIITELFIEQRKAIAPAVKKPVQLQTQPYNLLKIQQMRELDPCDIDHLVSIRGMVTRLSEIIPDLRIGLFECTNCKNTVSSALTHGKIVEPVQCQKCSERNCFQLIHNRCTFKDKQIIRLQENPEAIPEGHTPHTVILAVYDELVDSIKPGDRVTATGIFRAAPLKVSPNQRAVKSLYRTFLDVVHFEKAEGIRIITDEATTSIENYSAQRPGYKNSQDNGIIPQEIELEDELLRDEEEIWQRKREMNISIEEEARLIELSQRPDIYDALKNAVAPSIYEMDDVKRGILCQLFGGTNKKFPNGKLRGEIHVLLVGDPGVSKSQLLKHVHYIAPRGIYTSGKGSSAVGLTAYVTRDPDTGEYVLESGALVLSDYGVCCIDEFDKMNDSTRSILHEVMEQQTVSVAKAGIICSLNARTSILAAANPKESRYNDLISIVDNIQLPPTILSRFDLIFLVRDIPDRTADTLLCQHLLELYQTNHGTNNSDSQSRVDTRTLTRYITYAKNMIHPKITDETKKALVKGYVELRRLGSHRKQITATTRQLESLIRLSEAQARMRLSPVVTPRHVEEALRLVRVSIFKAATDPKSGMVDIDLLTTGRTLEQRLLEEQQREEEREDDDIIMEDD